MSPTITILAQHLLNGVLIGCAYALIAMGLTMIFGVMNIANFAHGEFYMLGGFVAFYLVSLMRLDYFVALPLAVAVVVALAVVLQHSIFRRLREAPVMTTTLVTIGLSIFLENAALLLWGPQPQSIPTPFPPKPLSFLGVYTTPLYLFCMAVTAALIVVGHVLIRRTRMGKAMRATFQNKEASALVGIRIDRIYAYAFAFGAALAAAAGAVLGGFIPVEPASGGVITLKAFIVVILGGMGSFVGAIVGGLLLGLAEALGAGYLPNGWKDAIGFFAVILVLLLRPEGLFKRA
ncbi:MAG TPA: branched-chain amino acid ABC transporter permease [Casimicrobiaceae bacterium]|nr:branched-chain amino acid ABC transporter permease [Casimicrobiaceae bacterium]